MIYLLDDGTPTTSDDASRIMWYGTCTYWTDDWDMLSKTDDGIPCCPKCGSVGFIIKYDKWHDGAIQFDEGINRGYLKFLMELKETCHGNTNIMDLWKKERGNG